MSRKMDDQTQDPQLHRRIWDAIPWVVNGSAGSAERERVLAHVAACDACQDEFRFHQQLHAGMQADAPPLPDAEPALQRLWARIDSDSDSDNDGAARRAPQPLLAQPVRAGWSRATRVLAAAVAVQAVGLAALGGALWERPAAAAYQTLSRSPAPAAGGATIRLVLAPEMRVGTLQALLARTGLRICESSGDGSILGLGPRAGDGRQADAGVGVGNDSARVLAELRATAGVLLAEPIATGNAR